MANYCLKSFLFQKKIDAFRRPFFLALYHELCIADQVRRTHLCALMFSDRASKASSSLTTSSLMSCKERHSHDSNTVNVCKGQSQNRFESVLCEGSSLDAALATKQSPEGGETK